MGGEVRRGGYFVRSIEDRYAESVRLALAWVGVVRRDRRGSGTAKGAGNGVWEWRGRAPQRSSTHGKNDFWYAGCFMGGVYGCGD